jgi:hypothetical protein
MRTGVGYIEVNRENRSNTLKCAEPVEAAAAAA